MTAETTDAGFDSTTFRHVVGHFPAGVVVVSSIDGEEPIGLAVSSFTSVSLDPPLVGFFAGRSSTTWPRIRRAGVFAACVLAEHQADVSRAFATSGGDKFAGHSWRPSPAGLPVLDEATAWLDCAVANVVDAGDHWFVLGRVMDLAAHGERRPLVFFRGRYTHLSR